MKTEKKGEKLEEGKAYGMEYCQTQGKWEEKKEIREKSAKKWNECREI